MEIGRFIFLSPPQNGKERKRRDLIAGVDTR
jgi:hypothetical protein